MCFYLCVLTVSVDWSGNFESQHVVNLIEVVWTAGSLLNYIIDNSSGFLLIFEK